MSERLETDEDDDWQDDNAFALDAFDAADHDTEPEPASPTGGLLSALGEMAAAALVVAAVIALFIVAAVVLRWVLV